MLDSDLAEIYEVEVRILKRAVRQNIKRFPDDFMFELNKGEVENLRSKFRISSLRSAFSQHGGNRRLPFAFTETGVGMLSSVLHSEKAIDTSIEIIRAFIELRKQSKAVQLDLIPRVEFLENELATLKQKFNGPQIRKFPRPLSFAEPEQVRVIQNAVARRWGLNAEDLKSVTRSRDIALPRHIAIYLVRKHLHMSFSDIGKCFGRRDHTTVLYAYRKIDAELDANHIIQNAINAVQEVLRS